MSSTDFFKSLYAGNVDVPSAEYHDVVSKLALKAGNSTVTGDQALQSLLVSYVTTNAKSLEEVKGLSAALAGIKQSAVDAVAKAFPTTNVESLVSAAKAAGYDVTIL